MPVVCDLEESESSDLSDLGVAGVVIRWIILLLMCWKSRYAVSDGAIESIFAILSTLFSYLSRFLPLCRVLADSFPKSVSAASRMVGLESEKFTIFVVCPRCHSLYSDEDCFQLVGLRRLPQKCMHVEFPNHPQRQHRHRCNEVFISTNRSSCSILYSYTYVLLQKHSRDFKMLPSTTRICPCL